MNSNLPIEVLVNILEFDGRFRYENRGFRGIIAKNDPRYTIVENLTTYMSCELRDSVHPYTNKDRWMVVIALSRNKTKIPDQNIVKPTIGLTIFSNWRYPGEWSHVWYNYENDFVRCSDLPITTYDECHVTQPGRKNKYLY